MTNPYDILGIDKSATESELSARYQELRKRYSEDRFLAGEDGNEGARRLMELEDAWKLIQYDLQKRAYANVDFGQVDGMIKAGNYDEAQRVLDNVTVRTAEWHYFQSIIYYKREWLTESRKQLALALSMEPDNNKYKEALSRLDAVMGNSSVNQQDLGGFNQQQRTQENMGNSLCRCCQMYIMLDCCCTLMQCCR